MKKLLSVILATLALALAGCGGDQATTAPTSAPAAAPTSAPTAATTASGPDFSDPASVAQAVFDGAASGDFEPLAGLCDPLKEGDQDTELICELATDPTNRDLFLAAFAKGKVSGVPALRTESGVEYADVPILVGADGTEEETLVLVNRAGKWYLSGL